MQQALGHAPSWNDEESILEDLPKLTTEHLKIKQRLSPLLELEKALINQLSPVDSSEREATHLPGHNARPSPKEVAVNSATTQWKQCLGKLVKAEQPNSPVMRWDDSDDAGRVLNASSGDMIQLWNDPVIQELLRRLKIRLQDHAGLCVFLRVFVTAGSRSMLSFLDSLERVTAIEFLPTDGKAEWFEFWDVLLNYYVEDILRARLKTLGT